MFVNTTTGGGWYSGYYMFMNTSTGGGGWQWLLFVCEYDYMRRAGVVATGL